MTLISEAFSGSSNASQRAVALAEGMRSGSKITIILYVFVLASAVATTYFYYQKLFQKKAQISEETNEKILSNYFRG